MVLPSEIRSQCNRRQPAKGHKPKMRGRKLRSGVKWYMAIKQKRVKQRPHVYIYICTCVCVCVCVSVYIYISIYTHTHTQHTHTHTYIQYYFNGSDINLCIVCVCVCVCLILLNVLQNVTIRHKSVFPCHVCSNVVTYCDVNAFILKFTRSVKVVRF